jgi:MoxR-like ATPase
VVEDPQRILDLQKVPERIDVHEDLYTYLSELIELTHEDHRVEVGVSPRGLQRLFEASRARAVMEGREYVIPSDIKRISPTVLAHRLVLTPEAQVNDVDKGAVVEDILDEVPVPTIESSGSGSEPEGATN